MSAITFEQLLRRSHWRLLVRTLLALSLLFALMLTLLLIGEQSREGSQRFLLDVRANAAHLRTLLKATPIATVDRILTHTARSGIPIPLFQIGSDQPLADSRVVDAFAINFAYLQRLPPGHLQWVDQGHRYAVGPMRDLGPVPPHWKQALDRAPEQGLVLEEPPQSPLFNLKYVEGGLDTLLIPIERDRAVAFVLPRRWLSVSDMVLVAIATVLALWLGGMLLLSPPALLLGYWQVRREARELARPLAQLTYAAETLQDGSKPARLPLEGAQETQKLALAFNAMAEKLADARSERERSRDALQRTLDTQRELFANISHDLRTPLTAISGYAEVLERDHPDLRATTIIRREAASMARLVDDLFELARLEASTLPLYPQPVPLREALQQIRQTFSKQAWDRGVLLKLETSDDMPAPVITVDPQRLSQILSNLVANAIRHTAPGGYIALRSGVSDDATWIDVIDSGSGIADEDLPRIFERSFRGDRARRDGSEQRHAGLGLTIAHELAEAMGGALSVTSTIGEGSTFTLRFPNQTCHRMAT